MAVRRLALFLGILLLVSPAGARAGRRVVGVVIDQCRADYLERYDLPNLRRLQERGATWPRAWVGHLASETVVSHAVLGSGLLPRSLPWGDEAFRDSAGLLGKPGALYMTSDLEPPQMEEVLRRHLAGRAGYPGSLARRVREALGGPVYVVGQKAYATSIMGCGDADGVIFVGPAAKEGALAGFAGPAGRGFPAALSQGRFLVDTRSDYGTAGLEYPVKGNVAVAGDDPEHEGGDLWAANVALEVARQDPGWRGLLVTMSGVDAVGHCVGGLVRPADLGQDPRVNTEEALHTADRAVGRLLDRLAGDETFFVVTADHGADTGRLVGDAGPRRGYYNWYTGVCENAEYLKPSKVLKPLYDVGTSRLIVADGAVRVWLKGAVDEATLETLAGLPGVVEVYARGAGGYERVRTVRERPAGWERQHLSALLESLAAGHAPDLVALLEEGITYGARGDHGGSQEPAQRIPLILAGPGVPRGAALEAEARLVDVLPTLARLLDQSAQGYDGTPLLPTW